MERLNILLIACHPKDMFNHCGCTLARHARRGDHVTTLAMTHGLRAHDIVVAEAGDTPIEDTSHVSYHC